MTGLSTQASQNSVRHHRGWTTTVATRIRNGPTHGMAGYVRPVMTLFAGRYQLGAPLGAGGYSRVLRAYDVRLDRQVAVKMLDVRSSDPSARERFVREALISGRINHPNAVTVFDTGDADGTLFITMQLIEGEDLAHHLRRVGPLSPDEAVAIADQVLAVLEVAHDNGIIHRDIKPSNILIQDDGAARLADFGIARTLDELTSGLTKTGQIIGTAKYLSPEQAAGQPLTAATDLYSTGIVLYEMLTGAVPFDGDHAVAVALAHQQRPVPPLRDQAAHVDPDLAAVVQRALAKDPAERYASAASMRAALDQSPAASTVVAGGSLATTASLPPDGGLATSPATDAVDATAPLPHTVGATSTPPSESPWFRRHRPLVVAFGLAALIALIAVAALARDDTSDNVATDSPAGNPLVSGPAATDDAAPDTTAAPSSAVAVMTIGELADRIAADPDSFGEKGSDLLNKVQEVQREKSDKQAEKASKVLEEIDKWVAEGKLDANVGQDARAILQPIADS